MNPELRANLQEMAAMPCACRYHRGAVCGPCWALEMLAEASAPRAIPDPREGLGCMGALLAVYVSIGLVALIAAGVLLASRL